MPFEIIEHTADIGVRATGPTFEEALAEAVRGLFAVLAPEARVEGAETHLLEVRSDALDELVVDVLDDVNVLHQLEHVLASDVRLELDEKDGVFTARIELRGERYDPDRHGRLLDVKATTYHELRVDREPALIEVIFDI